MNKTNRIRLFFVAAAVCGVISYRVSYYTVTGEDPGALSMEPDKSVETEQEQVDTSVAEEKTIPIMKEEEPFKYLIRAEDGLLVVYLADQETPYMFTDIELEFLSDDLKEEISNGKKFHKDEELFNFLENYSS